MALPILDKTWNIDTNVLVANSGNYIVDRRTAMFLIKDKLVNMPIPWTVIGSSDGVTQGMDAVDRWTSAAKVSFGDAGIDGTTINGWIVLQQTGIGPKFQILIGPSKYNVYAGVARISYSPVNGFGAANGGTDPAGVVLHDYPTASDELVLYQGNNINSPWLDGQAQNRSGNPDFRFHFWQSSDGACNRIIARNILNTNNGLNIFFEKPKNPIAAWTNPVIAEWVSANTDRNTYALYNDAEGIGGNAPSGGIMPLYATSEGAVSGALGQNITNANGLSGEWELYPQGLASNTNLYYGRHGSRFDVWWVSTAIPNGSTFPLTPSPTREFCVFDNMAFPWDGGLPVLI